MLTPDLLWVSLQYKFSVHTTAQSTDFPRSSQTYYTVSTYGHLNLCRPDFITAVGYQTACKISFGVYKPSTHLQ